eukprot:CAMPEP_0202693298 /NCGR_PEP_ID=MMETSP1385-20130828/7446_1 /ASSEMBLY_ACC=CAM_ASM_000861 /TAXON_ID=933848 /ORGANISM="Elphidium margaritaceum" /LENGTH=372 /DNA_ID=CAMNT_0049348957 /DNA_START=31 /DNA_END=1149 /DNA_ORIENTATION=-
MTQLTLTNFKERIQSFVDGVEDVRELYALMTFIPLDSIQDFVRNEIETFTSITSKSAYYGSLPIDDMLSPQVVQLLLSFNQSQHSQALVSKSWHMLCGRNQVIHLRHIYGCILKNKYVAFDASKNRSIVVHAKRKVLYAMEQQQGFIGPMTMATATRLCQSGDRLLMHDGEYEFDYEKLQTKTDISLIGVGKNVLCLRQRNCYHPGRRIYVENIEFPSARHCFTGPQQLVLKKCRFKSSALNISGNGDINETIVDECIFSDVTHTAILIEAIATKVHLLNNEFIRCATMTLPDEMLGVVLVSGDIEREPDWQSTLQLKCTGNLFVDCNNCPFAEDSHNGFHLVDSDRYLLESNVFRSSSHYNFDANKMYKGQ